MKFAVYMKRYFMICIISTITATSYCQTSLIKSKMESLCKKADPGTSIFINKANNTIDIRGIPTTLDRLKDYTKYQTVSEDSNMHELCERLIKSDSKTMATLTLWLRYLLEYNRKADIKELKKLN